MKFLEGAKPQTARTISRVARSSLRVGTRLFNPLALRFAGTRYLPLYAVLHHRGRRSGRSYTTPLVARPTTDGFIIPLPFGERTDWFRNIQAAGECIIRWKDTDYPVIGPTLVDWTTARPAFHPLQRVLVPLIGIKQFVRVQIKS